MIFQYHAGPLPILSGLWDWTTVAMDVALRSAGRSAPQDLKPTSVATYRALVRAAIQHLVLCL